MPLSDLLFQAQLFLDRGGWPMVVILAAAWAMWAMIFARFRFFLREEQRLRQRLVADWQPYAHREDWAAGKMRRRLLSEHRQACRRNLSLIGTLIKLCPLLGLLGTVLGMIEVFEVMALQGSGNVRAMAAGISKATLTTMAGMVVALSGLVVAAQLNRRAGKAQQRLIRAFET